MSALSGSAVMIAAIAGGSGLGCSLLESWVMCDRAAGGFPLRAARTAAGRVVAYDTVILVMGFCGGLLLPSLLPRVPIAVGSGAGICIPLLTRWAGRRRWGPDLNGVTARRSNPRAPGRRRPPLIRWPGNLGLSGSRLVRGHLLGRVRSECDNRASEWVEKRFIMEARRFNRDDLERWVLEPLRNNLANRRRSPVEQKEDEKLLRELGEAPDDLARARLLAYRVMRRGGYGYLVSLQQDMRLQSSVRHPLWELIPARLLAGQRDGGRPGSGSASSPDDRVIALPEGATTRHRDPSSPNHGGR